MAGSRKLEVQIVGDADKLAKTFRQASSSSKSFGSSLAGLGRTAGVAAGALGIAAAGGLAFALKKGIEEFSSASKVSAQTTAVLKSTGQAANVTAGQVDALAGSLMRKSGIDDEAIKSGENMLLTFTRIRNEAGKGNDIFNQATKATLDLSVAMGKDMAGSAILVGKALNDPLKGMTALGRAGIQFTDAQKKSIAAMVESGNVMGAQKAILAELNTQFGGSAEALGKTLPGQINVLKQSMLNLAGAMVASVAPAFAKAVDAAAGFVGKLSAAKGIKAKLNVAWEGILEAGQKMTSAIGSAIETIDWAAAWNRAQGIGEGLATRFESIDWSGVGKTIGDGIAAAINDALPATKLLGGKIAEIVRSIDWVGLGKAMGPGLAAAVAVAFATLLDPMFWAENWDLALAVGLAMFGRGIGKLVAPIGKFLVGTVGKAFDAGLISIAASIERISPLLANAVMTGLLRLPGLVSSLLGKLGSVIEKEFGRLSGLAKFIIKVLGAQAALEQVANFVERAKGKLDQFLGWLMRFPGQVLNAAVAIGRALIDGILAGVGSLGDRLRDAVTSKIEGALSGIRSRFGIRSPSDVFMRQVGLPLAEGIVQGLDGGLQLLFPKAQARLKSYTDKLEAQVKGARARLSTAMGSLSDKLLRAFDAETSAYMTPAGAEIAAINARRRMEDLQRALSEAQASGDAQAIARAEEDIRMVSLEQQDAAEQKAYDDRRAMMRENFANRLSMMAEQFAKEGTTAAAGLAAIQKLMLKFGVSFEEAGAYVGKSFLFGLEKAVGGAAAAAGGVRGSQTGGNVRPQAPTTIVVQSILDGKVIAESVQEHAVRYQRDNGSWLPDGLTA